MKKNKTILFSAVALVVFATVSISGCKKADTDSTKPKACFTLNSQTIRRIDTVTANASCTERAQSYSWSSNYFSNTSGSTAQFYTLGATGDINITLTATNADGEESITKTVTVRELYPSDYTGNYTCNDTCDDNQTYGPYPVAIVEGSNQPSLQLTGYFTNPTVVPFEMSSGVFTYSNSSESYYGSLTDANNLFVSYQLSTQTGGTLHCYSVCKRN